MVLTLWHFRDHNPDRSVEPAQLAMALKRFHEAFAGYPGELPEFTGQVEEPGKVLSNPSRTPTLPQDDREFLQAVQLRMVNSLQTAVSPVQHSTAIHISIATYSARQMDRVHCFRGLLHRAKRVGLVIPRWGGGVFLSASRLRATGDFELDSKPLRGRLVLDAAGACA
jgi:hypothetical protein